MGTPQPQNMHMSPRSTDIPVLIEYRAEPLDPAIGALHAADPAMAGRLRAHSQRIWERALPGALDGMPCAQIGAEDLLLHVASHLTTRHTGLRLLWLHDLRLIAARDGAALDWDYIVATAHALNLAQPVHAALAAAGRRLAAPFPAEPLQRLRASEGARRSVPRAVERASWWGPSWKSSAMPISWWRLGIGVGFARDQHGAAPDDRNTLSCPPTRYRSQSTLYDMVVRNIGGFE